MRQKRVFGTTAATFVVPSARDTSCATASGMELDVGVHEQHVAPAALGDCRVAGRGEPALRREVQDARVRDVAADDGLDVAPRFVVNDDELERSIARVRDRAQALVEELELARAADDDDDRDERTDGVVGRDRTWSSSTARAVEQARFGEAGDGFGHDVADEVVVRKARNRDRRAARMARRSRDPRVVDR